MLDNQKLDEILAGCEQSALANLRAGKPLPEVLNDICQLVESYAAEKMLVSVLLASKDGKNLMFGAAPSLPDHYNQAIDGLEIGIKAGSCGTAAFCRHAIFVVDIDSDPLWEDFRDLASPLGLRACWSVPLIGSDEQLLGTLAMYHLKPRSPSTFERELIERAGSVVTGVLTEAVKAW